MNACLNRRNFLKSASLLPLCTASGLGLAGASAQAAEPIKRCGGPMLKVSLNAYSFARLLNDHLRGRGKGPDPASTCSTSAPRQLRSH